MLQLRCRSDFSTSSMLGASLLLFLVAVSDLFSNACVHPASVFASPHMFSPVMFSLSYTDDVVIDQTINGDKMSLSCEVRTYNTV